MKQHLIHLCFHTVPCTMSLRALILQHSLPLLPRHSFSRQTLSAALQSVQSGPENAETAHSFLESASPTATTRRDPIGLDRLDDIGRENVIDTLFGSGTIAPARALLDAWQDAGLSAMESSEHPQSDVSGRLERRLEYSAGVGEHLVEVGSGLLWFILAICPASPRV